MRVLSPAFKLKAFGIARILATDPPRTPAPLLREGGTTSVMSVSAARSQSTRRAFLPAGTLLELTIASMVGRHKTKMQAIHRFGRIPPQLRPARELSTGLKAAADVFGHDTAMDLLTHSCRIRRVLTVLFIVAVWLACATTTPLFAYVDPVTRSPGPSGVLRGADIPEQNWQPGHRGVDLRAEVGETIHAAGDGVVAFAGVVAGTPVVSIDHPDGLRTTYLPVNAWVTEGDEVTEAEPIGVLAAPTDGSSGLHWGALTGPDRYIDPLSLLDAPVIRLKPVDGPEERPL